MLGHTFKGYAKEDPGAIQQKVTPIIVLLKLLDLAQTELATAMSDLVCAAFFFAMRTFEYTKTSTTVETKRTNIITFRNICFYRKNWILRHDQDIDNADWVNITFEYQKNDEMNLSACTDQITSVSAQSYCGKKSMTRIRLYKGTDPHTKCQVNTFMYNKGKRSTITFAGIQTNLRSAVQILGKLRLGFRPMEMGAHSICSGAAMAIYLTGV